MKRLMVCAALVFLVACATAKPPVVYLPVWEPLPAIHWSDTGAACLDAENAALLVKREQLMALRETTYLEMLKALGCQPAPKDMAWRNWIVERPSQPGEPKFDLRPLTK